MTMRDARPPLRRWTLAACIGLAALAGAAGLEAQTRGGPATGTARAAAPIDLTGYWVSYVTEDWRYRMLTPPKGDYRGVPMTDEARKAADAWDPAVDASAGNRCRAYGAAAIMRMPGRLHITWQDEDTLRVDTDAGVQTRLFRFAPSGAAPGGGTWQGHSTARWDNLARGRGATPAAGGSLTVTTTAMRAGYLRTNGVPYSEDAVLTEYFDVAPLPDGGQVLLVTAVVDDPRYLQQPFIVSSHFKKEADGARWTPRPCAS